MDHQTLKTSIHDDWMWAKDSQIKTNMMTVVLAKAFDANNVSSRTQR